MVYAQTLVGLATHLGGRQVLWSWAEASRRMERRREPLVESSLPAAGRKGGVT